MSNLLASRASRSMSEPMKWPEVFVVGNLARFFAPLCTMVLAASYAAQAQSAVAQTAPAPADATLEVEIKPARALIENTRFGQAVNFEFMVTNRDTEDLELFKIELEVRDPAGALAQKLELSDNGVAPGIEIVPKRRIAPGSTLTLLNPFHTIGGDIPIGRMDFVLHFFAKGDKRVRPKVSVTPARYTPRTRLQLPVKGRLLVWDGHDFYSHHRRLDFSHFFIKNLGLTTNAGRYAYDFVVVDAEGRMQTAPGRDKGTHRIYRQTVYAPGAGTIVDLRSDVDEMRDITPEEMKKDKMASFGNYVVIDHGNGEFSQIGHFTRGSVRVKIGDKVTPGQPIAEAGNSGSSIFPHVHYQLTDGRGADSEGIPSYFSDYVRAVGAARIPADGKAIDSGDIVETLTN